MARKRRNKRGKKEEEMQKELNIPKGRKSIKIKERRDGRKSCFTLIPANSCNRHNPAACLLSFITVILSWL